MRSFGIEVSRDGRFWLIRVPELGRSTQALRFKDVPTMAADLTEVMTGLRIGEYEPHVRSG